VSVNGLPPERRPRTAALHACVFFALFAATMRLWPTIGWPGYFLAPLAVYAIILLLSSMWRSMPRTAIGRLGGLPLAFAALVLVGAPAVLVGFQIVEQPDVSELAAKVPMSLVGSVLLAGIVFSIVNAVCEELVFRWLLYEAVAQEWNQLIAIAATAVAFGVAHLPGYPSGPIGALLAGLYGIALGILRAWTGGLGLAIVCHIAADAAIFAILHFDTATRSA
jgi:membrane protease YdiL (CAAX protease family)